jgi:serine/threonine protein kinase
VLKRVRNPKRHDRFRSEVEAIKRLNHPNIIRLIDHSALADDGSPPDQQFIVMPYASQGDLTSRVALYANNPDSVIQVAKSLALGLQAAHTAGIVHRDVKPPNVLFPTVTHDVWLGDFGICLIRDEERGTPADEVVGPVQFMAPELEGGGQLAVSPAADVYSLGKVIYYMLSGGTVLPRERLHDPEYAKIFMAGERQRLIETLLSRMICGLSSRLSSMADVLSQLDRIESWERDARLLPIPLKTLSAIEEMKRKALEVHRQTEVNADIRSRRKAAVAATSKGALDWFHAELEKTAAIIGDGHGITAGVRVVEDGMNDSPILNNFRPGPGVELWVRNTYETFRGEHLLRFSVCNKFGITVTTHIMTAQQPSLQVPPDEPAHVELMIVPSYGRKVDGTRPRLPTDWQFFAADGGLHRPVTGQNQTRRMPTHRNVPRAQPQHAVKVQAIPFSTADWPAIAITFSAIFQQSADAFISAMNVAAGPFG